MNEPDVTKQPEDAARSSVQRLVRVQCEFGMMGKTKESRCISEAKYVTKTSYKCCYIHAPRRGGKMRDDVKAL